MNIYVGNVPYAAPETDLEEPFQEYGPVATVTIIRQMKPQHVITRVLLVGQHLQNYPILRSFIIFSMVLALWKEKCNE